jgi:cytokinesis protein
MDSLFSRSKKLTKSNRPSITASELSERSVPYERAGAGRMPIQVGTVSQGLRAAGVISAPITNPTLTQDGTDLNIHSGARLRMERELAYGELSAALSGDDLQSQSRDGSTSTPNKKHSSTKSFGESSAGGYFSGGRRKGDSDTASSSTPYSGRGNMVDFGAYPISPAGSSRTSNLPSSGSMTTAVGDQLSGMDPTHVRYPSSILSNGSDTIGSVASHLRERLPEKVKDSLQNLRVSYYGAVDSVTSPGGEFNLPRPADPQEIEYMFERVRQERDMGDSVNMTLEQKWGIVHAHEQDRWIQQKRKDAQIRRNAAMGNGQSVMISKDTPEWYMKKFMDQTITAKHVGSLTVSLRTLPIESVHSRQNLIHR